MNIKSIEPTPSPNTMKINLTEDLPAGKSNNYKKDEAEQAPQLIKDLFKIEGIKGIYHVADFLAIERNAKYDWKEILIGIRRIFGEETKENSQSTALLEHYGEVTVLIQQFKGIPMQIKMNDGNQERRFTLPDYFIKAIASAQNSDDNVVMQRKWKDYGVRYGELEEIGQEVMDELIAAYPKERIQQLVAAAKAEEDRAIVKRQKVKLTMDMLNDENWEKRYQALEQMEDPTVDDIHILAKALSDNKVSIRRLAVVYLGMIEDKLVLPCMYQALKDASAAVRRTAGDCLSDLGFPEAMEEMSKALADKNKLVRWRAAMFLYELGDESVLPALKAAENDLEFEVSLQVKMAIERIENGEEARGSVWKQMTEARQIDNN